MLPMIIDFHTHVVSPKMKNERNEYAARDACFRELYSQPKAKLSTAEELVQSMDECGVDMSVILGFGIVRHRMCQEMNDYILDCVARYPQRLIGFCVVQPNDVGRAVKEVERCARSGARGIGEMRPDVQGFDLRNKKAMQPVVEAVMEHGLIFLAHTSEPVGHQYFGKGIVRPEMIYPFIVSFPDLKVVLAHWGGGLPFYALMPEVETAMANCYFDTAATPFLYKPQIFRHVADIVGSDKILFGSDNPLLSPRRIIDQINSVGLLQDAKEKILGGNARKLLGI
ncbi:MAG: amidohydrolase [Chloroflexi bacterium]|nr:amidohydrolase [Chloroflexota bacterium]MBM3172772.1 amidohydrolase [Chloroflexota bacterium]MBM3174917.1 amidohydrolase [Chloroflexota bacterium]MBM4449696.1 amidohydrolase [Chloroflexota bacterium]